MADEVKKWLGEDAGKHQLELTPSDNLDDKKLVDKKGGKELHKART